MRYLWVGGLIALVILGTSCSGGGTTTTRTTVHHHHRRHVPTTTTTKPTTTTQPKLASGVWDKASCAALLALSREGGMGHQRIARAFRSLIHDLHNAENTTLHHNGRVVARGLLRDDVPLVKLALTEMFKVCREMT